MLNRRDLLVNSGAVAGAATAGILQGRAEEERAARRLHIVVAGAHPGDPEAACGGTMALLADRGHEVIALYTTRGERGIAGKSSAEAGAIRTREGEKACALLKARPLFADQVDADTRITPAHYDSFRRLLETAKPDAVLTHWPLDTHRDHRGCALLVYDAWLTLGRKFGLYFFEVSTGQETQHFRPTDYVNITAVEQRKRAACFAHASQNPRTFYADCLDMQRFRGRETGCKHAEAFIHHEQSPRHGLPA
ncbi:MAG TPA: PIG-L family deacetylase [Gemmataceae bacterium]|nr:PIG-L family deacetylase [Gemmataceae bacterium]